MAGSQADEADEVGDYLWTYDAEPGDWAHMQDAKAIETMYYYTKKGRETYDFPDWILRLVEPPDGGYEIQCLDEDEYHCLECGLEFSSKENTCGPRCWRKFQEAMQDNAKRIEIHASGAAGLGAWLEENGKPIEDLLSYIGIYTGIIYPEVPRTKWENSRYVLPINGEDWDIEGFRTERPTRVEGKFAWYFIPQWGGPTRMSSYIEPSEEDTTRTKNGRALRIRGQKPKVKFAPAAYDTDTYGVMVDAAEKGNWTRYMNSSCDPNLEASAEQVGKVRVTAFRPIKRIQPGRQLTFYYGNDYFTQHGMPCLCACKPEAHEPGSCGSVAEQNITDVKGQELPPGLQYPPQTRVGDGRRKFLRKRIRVSPEPEPGPSHEELFPSKKKRKLFRYDCVTPVRVEQQDVEMVDDEEQEAPDDEDNDCRERPRRGDRTRR